jgi:hypothetical protein
LVGAGRRLRFLAQSAVAPELVQPNPTNARSGNHFRSIRPATKWMTQGRRPCSLPDDQCVKKLLRSLGVFLSVHQTRPAMPYLETPDPKQNIFRNIRCVIGDSLQVSRGKNEMKVRRGE